MKHGGENKEMANVFKRWQQSWVGGEGRNSNHILADPPITQSRHLQSKLKNYFPVFFALINKVLKGKALEIFFILF